MSENRSSRSFGSSGAVLAIDGTCPGEVTLTIGGGTPDGVAAILRGRELGNGVIPIGPCAGTPIDIVDVRLASLVSLDGDGNFFQTQSLPPSICGQEVQIVDGETCGPSNVVSLPEL